MNTYARGHVSERIANARVMERRAASAASHKVAGQPTALQQRHAPRDESQSDLRDVTAMVSKKLDPVDLVVTRVDRPGARLCYTSARFLRTGAAGPDLAPSPRRTGDEENWSVTAVAQRMWHGGLRDARRSRPRPSGRPGFIP